MSKAKVLHRLALKADVLPIVNSADLKPAIQTHPFVNVVISAPWILTTEMQRS